jgi:hypothetical protein
VVEEIGRHVLQVIDALMKDCHVATVLKDVRACHRVKLALKDELTDLQVKMTFLDCDDVHAICGVSLGTCRAFSGTSHTFGLIYLASTDGRFSFELDFRALTEIYHAYV